MKPQHRVTTAETYDTLDVLDGSHPYRDHVPAGAVLYPVRRLKRARIQYFNFALAREMGILPADHPGEMNSRLERKLIRTFALHIVNEYDQKNRTHLVKDCIPDRLYMATRYLQLQHPSKDGRTSGDGRCVWNGVITHQGKTWDVNSRGTGVTCLAPGSVITGRHLMTGQDDVGYGCGMAELDELYSSAIMSELLHRQGIRTERSLLVLDIGGGFGIGVRAGQNLIRPAHMFLFLKQENFEFLKKSVDYFIERERRNGIWKIDSKDPLKYRKALNQISTRFAQFAAQMDVEYIFAWLDWDGDNVLATAGIIDYGSIRQFGLRHDQYRYDDVDRFSTNLNEQKQKARLTIQVFAQIMDYLKTGMKRPLRGFVNDPSLELFDREFAAHRTKRVLHHTGLTPRQIESLLDRSPSLAAQYVENYRMIESFKTHRPAARVADGVNRPAIFSMRGLLRKLPAYLAEHSGSRTDKTDTRLALELFHMTLAENARGRDRKMSPAQARALLNFFKSYTRVMNTLGLPSNFKRTLRQVDERSRTINRENRVTGNSVTLVVEQLLKFVRRNPSELKPQPLIDRFLSTQVFDPSFDHDPNLEKATAGSSPREKRALRLLFNLVENHKEDI